MMRAEPRLAWPERGKAVHHFSCRSMHTMHERLFTKQMARKRASERPGTGIKKPLIVQRLCGINELGGMQNHSGPASDVLLLVPVVLPVLFPAAAVR